MDNPYPWPLFSAYPPPKNYLPVEQICKMTAFEEGRGKYFLSFLSILLIFLSLFIFYLCQVFPPKVVCFSFIGDPLLEFLESSQPVPADR